MVRTMSLLRALLSTARAVRQTPQLAPDGLPPDHAVLLDAPDERLAPALVAAALGDHEPAAKLLAATRGAAEWESRDRYVTRLAAFAHSRDAWLTGWLADAPHDPDALLVRAEVAVRKAWESPARAERLRELGPLIDAAADAAPRDPVPWRLALDHARGTHATHTVFETLWEQAVRRAAHHYGCHVAALKYLSTQRRGSHRECVDSQVDSRVDSCFDFCFDFAEQAAADALPGSLIKALPVRAAFARLTAGGEAGSVPEDRVDAAADLAIELSGRYAVADPWPAEVRNVLVYVLVGRARWAAALDQFRLIGPYATSFPWSWGSDDPLGRFLDARHGVRLEVAASVPLRGRAGRGRSGGHYA
ncbi:hypothetical protein AMK26_05055 [Streptomyces sp. CB03234]|uniref:hypothetical protein n=1 Tax=Streptomyces sp. (strain CB03234) TaxID=1703937 RepID=UPI00093AE561|nr:hypothetical protein [Streptomyces sp. CB03234]OKK08379.1 hypothetical protein AMK26_05055 [Streptomyces sp. CB03234]